MRGAGWEASDAVMSRRTTFLKAMLSALHYSGADAMIAPLTRRIGAILMLHHVRPEKPSSFEPNHSLKVTPDFLEQVISQVIASGFEIVALDEAHFRLIEGNYGKPFVCFTFDDGYRDNLEYAYPIFKRHNLPFAIYVPTEYADGYGDLWWLALEKVIAQVEAVSVKLGGVQRRLRCGTPAAKDAAFQTIYWWLRSIDEADARAFVRELCEGVGFIPGGRSARDHWRAYPAPLRAGQAHACGGACRDGGERAALGARDR